MRPRDVAVLFDELAGRHSATVTHLSRPFDIAPEGGTRYSVPRLAHLVRTAAGWLHGAGVRPGDRVAIAKPNHWDYDLLALAAVRLRAVPAQLSGYLPGETLGLLLRRLDPTLLVTTRAVLEAAARDGTDLAAGVRTLTLDGPAAGTLCLDDVAGDAAPVRAPRHEDDPLVIVHTSGTTGVPKLVVHSTATMVRRLARLESLRWPLVGLRRDDVAANASAYAHGRTFCWTASAFCLEPGAVLVFANHDPASAGPLLRAHPPTVVEGLPATYLRWEPLTGGAGNPFRNVRMYVSTYDAMHPPTVRAFLAASRRRGAFWMQGWGQSETGPLTFRFLTRRSLARAGERHPTTRDVGRPVPGRTRLRMVDPETFVPVPAGRPGLVFARTPARCLGYVGEPERFVAKDRGGWFNTGDLGVRTPRGRVRLLDREVDMMPDGSCIEIEDVIDDRLPEVVECVVLAGRGSAPVPVVVTTDGRLDKSAWRAAVADLPPLADPVVLDWAELPRTGTGKVRRAELRARLLGTTQTAGTGRWT